MGQITIVGLGPGDFGLITLDTWDKITNTDKLILRTAIHPTVAELDKRNVVYTSCDEFYEQGASFDDVYNSIAQKLIEEAKNGHDVVYAVPGSPLVAERTVVIIRQKAKEADVKLNIMPGMSFMEVLYQRLNIDPIDGLTILDACDLENLPSEMPSALVITQVYNQHVASDTKLTLMENYPEDYPVTFIRNLSLPDEEIREIPLYELDRQPHIDHLTSLYIGKMPKNEQTFDLEPLEDVVKTLRSPGGCPWDIVQTHKSLRRNLIEEVYEVIEAIDLEDEKLLCEELGDLLMQGGCPWDIVQTHKSLRRNLIEEVYEVIEAIDLEDEKLLCEELGDLLMQVVFHARMAEEAKLFSMQDVIDGITEKLIRRHPHVFGDVDVKDAGEVLANWEAIKQAEKTERTSILDGVPKDLPSLMAAYKLQHKAAKVGFDWPDIDPVWDKLEEELRELEEAIVDGQKEKIEEELGDVLFTIVNISRFLKIDPEVALAGTNRKFKRRFSYIEEKVKAKQQNWESLSLIDLDELWQEAKLKDEK